MYEYNKVRAGLGALGWTPNWTVPMSSEVRRDEPCAGGGRMICNRFDPAEQGFLTRQGCRPTTFRGLEGCTTGSGLNGSLWCCPPGRPGTADVSVTAVAQAPVSRQNIIALQNYIVSQGCSVGSAGADGIYGPRTREGLQCVIDRTSYVNVSGRFPFIATLISTPTGGARPAGMVFDPGITAKTPEQVFVAGSPGGGGGTVSDTGSTQEDVDTVQPAGIFGALPWWAWAAIALGGVATLGVVGVLAFGKDEEDFEEEDIEYLGGYR